MTGDALNIGLQEQKNLPHKLKCFICSRSLMLLLNPRFEYNLHAQRMWHELRADTINSPVIYKRFRRRYNGRKGIEHMPTQLYKICVIFFLIQQVINKHKNLLFS
jgi:hypothetical protein